LGIYKESGKDHYVITSTNDRFITDNTYATNKHMPSLLEVK